MRTLIPPIALVVVTLICGAAAAEAPPTFVLKWGSAGTGPGEFGSVSDLDVDAAGNVYVTDPANNRIQKFTNDGLYLSEWSISAIFPSNAGSPRIATDGSGAIYVTDPANSWVQKFDTNGTLLFQFGSLGSGDGQLGFGMNGIDVDSDGNVFVVDRGNYRIQKFDANGTYLTQWGSRGTGDGEFELPGDVAASPTGDVFVTDLNPPLVSRVQKFTNDGVYLTQWGAIGSGDGQFGAITGIASAPSGNVYTSELPGALSGIAAEERIQKFDASGGFLTKWGQFGTADGEFVGPQGIATDSNGNIFVVDSNMGDYRIQKFAPAAVQVDATTWGRVKADRR